MPRRPRIILPGIPVHVIQRGNNRGACFFADSDYRRYLRHLEELAAKFGCAIHAYVLMTNHVHLLLTTTETRGVSLLMKHLGQRYVQYVNRTYRRSGTLWEGRFRSCIVQEESYLLRCYRYIELNPVRARVVGHPRDYRWSSYRFNAEGKPAKFTVPHMIYLRLGQCDETREAAYRGLFAADLDRTTLDEIRQATAGNFALGGDRFRRQIADALGRRVARGQPGRPPGTRGQTRSFS